MSREAFLQMSVAVLKEMDSAVSRPIVQGLVDHLPARVRAPLTRDLVYSRIVHHSYLHTLCVLGQSLGGLVLSDQLTQQDINSKPLFEYLPVISEAEAERFTNFAATLIGRQPEEKLDRIRRFCEFPDDYAANLDIDALYTDERVTELIFLVVDDKDLLLPQTAREQRLYLFLSYLLDEFTDGHVHTNDMMAMIKTAVGRLKVDAKLVVNFFKDSLGDLAIFIAETYDITPPDVVVTNSDRQFLDQSCSDTHVEVNRLLDNVSEVYVTTEAEVERLRQELEATQCVAVMHHEPPRLLPRAPRLDMLSVRTIHSIFHIPTSNKCIFGYALNWIKQFNNDKTIYARSPQGLIRILVEVYGWLPNFVDVKPNMDQALGTPNSTFSELARFLTNSTGICWIGKVFSADLKPSRTALRHRSIFLSLVYSFSVMEVGTHRVLERQEQEERDAAAAEAAAEQRRQEEEERQREEEEQRRQEEERQRQEEERQRLEDEERRMQREQEKISSKIRRLEEEKRRLAEEWDRRTHRHQEVEDRHQREERRRREERDRDEERRRRDSRSRHEERDSKRQRPTSTSRDRPSSSQQATQASPHHRGSTSSHSSSKKSRH